MTMNNGQPESLETFPASLQRAFANIEPGDHARKNWMRMAEDRWRSQQISREPIPWIWIGASAAAAIVAMATTLVVPLSADGVTSGAANSWQLVRANVEHSLSDPMNGLLNLVTDGGPSDSMNTASRTMQTLEQLPMMSPPAGAGRTPLHIPMVRIDWLTEPLQQAERWTFNSF